MSTTLSPSQDTCYGVVLVCQAFGIGRSTYYDWKKRASSAGGDRPSAVKRGPKTAWSDSELADQIRSLFKELEALGIRGEGYRKVHARLRFKGHAIGRKRVLRVMREHGLLAPTRTGRKRGPRIHDGTIQTETPDRMWGTDATKALTLHEGEAWVFAAVDHCTGQIVGIHASLKGNRFEALEPIHQGVREHFEGLEEDVAVGLALRHDHGTQYMSRHFQAELRFLGIESSPSFVRAPEGNGVAERFFRTLKEQLLWVEHFETVEDLRIALQHFRVRYNESWILARHGYKTPDQVGPQHKKAA